MFTRIISFLSFGFIIVGTFSVIYQTYWLTKVSHTTELEVIAPYSTPQTGRASTTATHDPIEEGEKIGVLTIPKLQKTLPIYEGVGEESLKNGIGHIPSTPIPGQKSNAVLAGHRDTYLLGLDHLKNGDSLITTIQDKSFIYKIKKIRIVDKDDKTVIVPKPRSTLTIITCYPFNFIGPAPQRYIVEAERLTKVKVEQSPTSVK